MPCVRARGTGPAVCFTAAADALIVRAKVADAAVECRIPGEYAAETLWLPFEFLADCGGKKDDLVHVEATGKRCVTAQWRDGSVPQIVRYDVPKPAAEFPVSPDSFAENPPGILQALVEAGESTEPDAVRFATNCIQLRGTGSINATDGKQLLVQEGFAFPWEGDLLLLQNKVFASPELAGDGPVGVGRSGDWVVFRTGTWTISLAVNKDGRFPDVLAAHPASRRRDGPLSLLAVRR